MFKVGNMVTPVENRPGLTSGRLYRIQEVFVRENMVRVIRDDGAMSMKLFSHRFKLVKQKTTRNLPSWF